MPTGPFTVIESNNTTVQFATASGTADEGAGTYDLVVTIANPDANNATTADVVLVSGDPADLGNYTTQTVTFPAGSSADQIVTITITDDSEVEGDEDFTFQLQNVSGGNGAMAGSPSQHVLTITDNDFADVPDIVINEIMQNPSAVDDSKGEWFELYNNDTETVDINGWIIKDDGVDYHVIDNGGPLTIAPGEYLVLGNNDTTTVNGGVPVDYMYDNFLLSNSDDEVVLVYSDGVTEVDRVNYDGGPNFPDPSGASMELKNPNYDNNDGANWDTATTPFGDGDLGTPGARNSNFVSALEDAPALNVESFKIMQNYPNPFNPETKLLVHLSSNVRQLKIDIFNAAGQHVKSIYQGALSAGQHTFSWNGRDNSGKNSPSGVYFATMKSANAQHSIKMILLR
ncbi:lamin tail domain-containing protein [Caldithrix abyssi]|nr:lamin tail domain-containing protein [Caldithrix abyssi]APF20647.1 Por secretion system C-terminal sorting domain-containing protein [Caldithrix abyssi DSM 13497]